MLKGSILLVELYLHQRQSYNLNTDAVQHAQVPKAAGFFNSQWRNAEDWVVTNVARAHT